LGFEQEQDPLAQDSKPNTKFFALLFNENKLLNPFQIRHENFYLKELGTTHQTKHCWFFNR